MESGSYLSGTNHLKIKLYHGFILNDNRSKWAILRMEAYVVSFVRFAPYHLQHRSVKRHGEKRSHAEEVSSKFKVQMQHDKLFSGWSAQPERVNPTMKRPA